MFLHLTETNGSLISSRMTVKALPISTAFIWRRVHSLMGFWLVLYLAIHLLTNSQAALWIGDDGSGFVRLVNFLESLPYLQVVETVLIGIPLVVHGAWGIKRALEARCNDTGHSGHAPSLSYSRNRAFTWQRLSSWVLLFGIIGHVAQMRFWDAPTKAPSADGEKFLAKLNFDEGLYTLAPRLHVALFYAPDIEEARRALQEMEPLALPKLSRGSEFVPEEEARRAGIQEALKERAFLEKLACYQLRGDQVVAVSSTPGTAFLLMVRETFKSPLMAVLYTIFVLAAVFHACNGFWTFLITWGLILSYRSQKTMLPVSMMMMFVLSFLGLAAIWCSYWVNLRY